MGLFVTASMVSTNSAAAATKASTHGSTAAD